MSKSSKKPAYIQLSLFIFLVVSIPSLIVSALLIVFAACGMFGEIKISFLFVLTALIPFILGMLAALIINAVLSKKITGFHRGLLSRIEDIDSGNYSAAPHGDADHPIYSGINRLSVRMAELRDTNLQLEAEKNALAVAQRNAVIRSLGAKSNPAMLKKVLNGIERMAHEGRCADIAELTDDAACVLEASLEDGARPVSLADELSRIKRYLEVHELVTGEKINFRMSVMCNIVDYRIIPNIILPVVQNIFDAAEVERQPEYELGVEVTSSSGNLLIIIRDNAASTTPEAFQQIESNIDSLDFDLELDDNDNGLSVAAINYRLKHYYGDAYGLKLSGTNLGSVAYLYLPPHISA